MSGDVGVRDAKSYNSAQSRSRELKEGVGRLFPFVLYTFVPGLSVEALRRVNEE